MNDIRANDIRANDIRADALADELEQEWGKPPLALSIVIPLYNEEESIPSLYTRLTAALDDYGRPFEAIIIDDGSSDRSFELLAEIARKDTLQDHPLRRNFGQTAAFSAGFDAARGDVIITMDADLQNDPADIPCS
ncbi:MAG: glycosyltransferase [Caldilineaceae bacterium]